MTAKIALFILWFVVWLMLAWPVEAKDVITAALVSALVSYMTADLVLRPAAAGAPAAAKAAGKRVGIAGGSVRVLWFFVYVVVFLWECIKANIDVAFRVVAPHLPIRPGTVKVKVALKSDIGLTFLASSITLTPGTTTVDIDKEGGYLYVHQLYVREAGGRLKAVERYENILKRIFG